jgi:hypothetical protein
MGSMPSTSPPPVSSRVTGMLLEDDGATEASGRTNAHAGASTARLPTESPC